MRRNTVKAMNSDDIRKGASDGMDAVVDQFQDATEHVENAFQRGKEQLAELQKQGLETARDAAKSADKFVRERPWEAVGIAAALGLVAGLLIRRR